MEELKQAVALDPEDWLVRRQGWAIEKPEAFYDGEVNFEWKAERMKLEAENTDDSDWSSNEAVNPPRASTYSCWDMMVPPTAQ